MPFQSYSEYVANILSALTPILPKGIDPKTGFSGAASPSQESAVLKGERALFLRQTAIELEQITGVDASLYEVKASSVTRLPLLGHAAYPKNLRRWLNGTIPRKIKARADFVLVAVCWLMCWGDEDRSASDGARASRGVIASLAGLSPDAFEREPSLLQLAEALWSLSAEAYKHSLNARR